MLAMYYINVWFGLEGITLILGDYLCYYIPPPPHTQFNSCTFFYGLIIYTDNVGHDPEHDYNYVNNTLFDLN